MNHHVRRALAALAADDHAKSGWLRRAGGARSGPPESYIHEASDRIQPNASWISGWTDHGAHLGLRPGLVDRWRIRRAVRAWARRRRCHLEGHGPATYERKGTRRSSSYRYVAEDVTQTRGQCRRCGEGLTDWEDVEGSVRGFTGYKAPAALHDRVMYGGGDWSEPREVKP